jgi:hypothetical protein
MNAWTVACLRLVVAGAETVEELREALMDILDALEDEN